MQTIEPERRTIRTIEVNTKHNTNIESKIFTEHAKTDDKEQVTTILTVNNSPSELLNMTMNALPVVKEETNHLNIVLPCIILLVSTLVFIIGGLVYRKHKNKMRNQSRIVPNYYPKIAPPKQIQVGILQEDIALVN